MQSLDSRLINFWDEFCVQVQGEESIFWRTCGDIVNDAIYLELEKLPKHELEALWLQTDEGQDWLDEEAVERESDPVSDKGVAAYIRMELLSEAQGYENSRIRDYMGR